MDRPTKEQVDAAIDLDSLKYEAVLDAYNVLRAEVFSLRESMVDLLGLHQELSDALTYQMAANARFAGMLARVEALPELWRRKARQLDGYDVGMHEVRSCAADLEAALKPA